MDVLNTYRKYRDLQVKLGVFRKYTKDQIVCQVGMSLDRYYSDVYPLYLLSKSLYIVEANYENYFRLMNRFYPFNLPKALVINVALGAFRGETEIVWGSRLQQGTSRKYCTFSPTNTIRMPVVSFDELMITVDVLILTVNGAEYDVLCGAKTHLKEGKRVIWVGNRRYDNNYCLDHDEEIKLLLNKYGYNRFLQYVGRTQDIFVGENQK